ncbi:hypothetical protein IMZ29_12770 [Achromobacter sp. GG226]|uniref:hypothetical protein n=1 Tax=Verticiella alkaliphila TaxID=2779529 RepID=UPI001C0AE774|nr:hypothetical protein [Verticiella sp. GG226]MBU4611369.1 hypothetical protein [Verticiella sp. GG226]
MTPADQAGGRAEVVTPLLGSAVLAVVASAVWYLSPLALGFASWPSHPMLAAIARGAFQASYFVGIPALLACPVIGMALALSGRRVAAMRVVRITFASFAACVALVVLLVN